jgi:ATP-dependent Clp protease adaptor protein ClpS
MATLAPARPPKARRTPRRGGGGTGEGGWAVIVLNDDHNTFEHVIATLCRVIPAMTPSKADSLAWKVHRSGRAVVWTGLKEPCELYVEQLTGAGLTMAPPTQL